MYRDLLIRILVLVVLILQGVYAYLATGFDDFLPFRVVYAGTVAFHAYHAWQLYQYETATVQDAGEA
jgi:hypothetical protein